jgi:hypothetical protein
MVKFTGQLSALMIGAGSIPAPLTIPGLIAWHDAALGLTKAGGGTPANGDPIESWLDLSGNNNTLAQSTGAAQPLYQSSVINSKPAINFDGTDDYLERVLSTAVTSTTATWVAVLRCDSFGYQDRYAVLHDVTNTDYNIAATGIFVMMNSDTNLRASRNNLDRGQGTKAASPNNIIVGSVYDGTNSTIYVNGVAGTPVACTGSFNATRFILGAGEVAGAANFADIQVAESLLYNTSLNSTQMGTLNTYLNAKYAVY